MAGREGERPPRPLHFWEPEAAGQRFDLSRVLPVGFQRAGHIRFNIVIARLTDPSQILDALPAAVFLVSDEGRIRSANAAGLALAGQDSVIGMDLTVALGLAGPDGCALPSDGCPARRSLAGKRALAGIPLSAAGAGGARIPVLVSTRLLPDAGVVVLVADAAAPQVEADGEMDRSRLVAIVATSNDAIISKTLDGTITTWNAAATRIFGYAPEEMIGESVLRIIPPELQADEEELLAKLRRGERVMPFDTVRMHKDGSRIDISLTISPLRNAAGTVIGASKIARDIGSRKRAEALQAQLFDELSHRVKNTLATMQSIATLALKRPGGDPRTFVASFSGQLQALGTAHDLIVRDKMQGASLRELVSRVVRSESGPPLELSGPEVVLDPRLAVPLALALNELATDALRGHDPIRVDWELRDGSDLALIWRESKARFAAAEVEGSAESLVLKRVLDSVDGSVRMESEGDGRVVRLDLPLPRDLVPRAALEPAAGVPGRRRALVVEDEALIAMDIEAQLTTAGYEVVGPAGTIEEAIRLIGTTAVDVALVDANVRGRQVGEVAEALAGKGIPFAFATGYGRSALPAAFQTQRILAKPFSHEELVATVAALLDRRDDAASVIPGDA